LVERMAFFEAKTRNAFRPDLCERLTEDREDGILNRRSQR